jgi:DNA-binding MarR family transcriptional regulator
MANNAPTTIEFSTCVCLRLRKVTRKVTQIYDRALEPAGLTITQFSVLAHVSKKADRSIGELANRMMMDQTTLTRVLRPLERQGLVELVGAREDRRRRILLPTRLGRKAFADAVPLWRQAQADLTKLLGKHNYHALGSSLGLSIAKLS